VDSTLLLDEWRGRARVAQISHYKTAVKLDRRHRRIGLLVVVLNAVVGTAVFATLAEQANIVWVKVGVGLISILAAVLVGIQTFERAGERAEVHRQFATRFSEMQREVELYVATGDKSDQAVKQFLTEFNTRYTHLVKEAPTADEEIHAAAKQQFKAERAAASTVAGLGDKGSAEPSAAEDRGR
jgi:hypothetical protein